jgi:hypothetical protein
MNAAYSVEFLAWDEIEVNDEASPFESLAWDRIMEGVDGDNIVEAATATTVEVYSFESPVWDRIVHDKE